ncbi:MAG: hypothetical protein NTV51_18960, partial [Verrucomicrobia bacterium]|nr:hypothetical protein [Verrucomicrobiota bacterium]
AGGCGAAGAVIFNTYVGDMLSHYGAGRVFAIMALLHPLAAIILCTMTRRERPAPSSATETVGGSLRPNPLPLAPSR